ncbi:MAG: dihydroorotate dehydrogenase electron transfer subunit [Candidatus Aminicenantes bacterium]|nr:dihydroorotate dehydrogenase electron transfer subunit [Candidatus Aminicenantes bacterium]
MKIDPGARIVGHESWHDYHLLSVAVPAVAAAAAPGQFVMVKVNDQPYPLLRRPLSIHGRNGDRLEFFFKTAGVGTAILATKQPGDGLDLLGPLGRGFRPPERAAGKLAYLVGGGRGIAPLFFLAEDLHARGVKVRVFYGGRTAADIPLRPKFERACWETGFATDDGSFGFAGLVTTLFAQEAAARRPDIVYACGPDPMFHTLAGAVRTLGVPAQFSLESIMGCGIGACWGCVHRIRKDGREAWVKICEDGPVFAASDIVWPEKT